MLAHKAMHTFTTIRRRPLAGLVIAAAGLAGCGGSEDTAPPQGTMAVQLSRPRVALGSPVDVTYRFTVARTPARSVPARSSSISSTPTASRCGPTTTTRRHRPPAWKPGQTIEYSRTMFAPVYPYVGQAKIIGGLYDTASGDRVRLSGTEAGGRAYEVAQLELLPQTENIFLIFKDGWHAVETAGDNSMVEWQWTKKEATITFRNPRRDARVVFPGRQPRQGGDRRPPDRDPPRRPGAADAWRSRPMTCPCTRSR